MFVCEGASILDHRIWHLRRTQETQPSVPGAGVIPFTGFQRNCWGQGQTYMATTLMTHHETVRGSSRISGLKLAGLRVGFALYFI